MSADASTEAATPPAPRYDERGLLTAVVQDRASGEVLMVGWVNAEALRLTLEQGQAWFFSRSRGRLWRKGETSGNVLRVAEVRLDCDGDTLLYLADPTGPTCHTGAPSCFFSQVSLADGQIAVGPAAEPAVDARVIDEVAAVIRDRQVSLPEGSYTAYLFRSGIDKIGKKIGEESAEVIIAAKNGDTAAIALETADLFYHALVMLAQTGVDPARVWAELGRRRG